MGERALEGQELLDAVTASMVSLHAEHHHREPLTAKSQLLGDGLLVSVLGGVYTEVEKTMIELEGQPLVRETRSTFVRAVERRFIQEVEALSGRRVVGFMSDSHVGPDLEVLVFVLDGSDHPG